MSGQASLCAVDIATVHDRFIHDWAPRWGAREREGDDRRDAHMPRETVDEIRASGLLAAPIPRELGGAGQDLRRCAELVRWTAREAPATALCLVMPLGNAANARVPEHVVEGSARDELNAGKRFIATHALAGRVLAVANSEPGAQGALDNTRTRAVRDAHGVVRLSGRKSFATWGSTADYFLCSARDEQGALDAFFVARDAPGVLVDQEWDPLGMRSSESVGLLLDDAPAAQRFLYPGAIVGTSARHWSTVLLAALFVGVAEGALAEAAKSAPPSSAFAQCTLAESALSIEAAWGFVEAVASVEKWPCGGAHQERCQRAKTFAARVAVDVTTRLLTLSGGKAYRSQHPLARSLHAALAGPLVRPPLANAMDAIARGGFEILG